MGSGGESPTIPRGRMQGIQGALFDCLARDRLLGTDVDRGNKGQGTDEEKRATGGGEFIPVRSSPPLQFLPKRGGQNKVARGAAHAPPPPGEDGGKAR